jgi:hypothetical protein
MLERKGEDETKMRKLVGWKEEVKKGERDYDGRKKTKENRLKG